MKSHCQHDYENPVRIGRANYACPKCGADISLELFFMMAYELDDIKLPQVSMLDCVSNKETT